MKPIRYVSSENPYQKMWDTFVFFESEPTTKEFLAAIYDKSGNIDSNKYAFLNTSKFIYFVKQAREYFFSAEKSSILVKPLLIYYGMMNLMKAVILTKDPNYPDKTSVLRHGITTRKLKKVNYQFHDDEIKIQKEGLLPLFYTIITDNAVDKIEGNKYKIKDLLSLLPEIHDSYVRLFNEKLIFPITIQQLDERLITLTVTNDILKLYGDKVKFLFELNILGKGQDNSFTIQALNDDNLTINWVSSIPNPLKYANFFAHPLIIQDFKGGYYFRPLNDTRLALPEIMVDYMLMYNLGMLCRYETELWGEIIFSFSSEDMYLINELVNITMRKFPNLILNYLFEELLVFETN